jgi:hypothetical protein
VKYKRYETGEENSTNEGNEKYVEIVVTEPERRRALERAMFM